MYDIKLKTIPDISMNLPKQFQDIQRHLSTLDFYAKPNYNYIYSKLEELVHLSGQPRNAPFDWQVQETQRSDMDQGRIKDVPDVFKKLPRPPEQSRSTSSPFTLRLKRLILPNKMSP